MIFTYWEGSPKDIEFFTKTWSRDGVKPSIYGDDIVVPILQRLDSTYVDIYQRIRIPACKSDIARIVLLHEFGGIYMDAHAAPKDETALQKLAFYSNPWEFTVFDDPRKHAHEEDVCIYTGTLMGKKDSSVLTFLLYHMFQNLFQHRLAEANSPSHVPYNILKLVGPWEVRVRLFEDTKPYPIKPEFRSRVFKYVLDRDLSKRPFLWYVN